MGDTSLDNMVGEDGADFSDNRIMEYETRTYGDNIEETTKTYLCGNMTSRYQAMDASHGIIHGLIYTRNPSQGACCCWNGFGCADGGWKKCSGECEMCRLHCSCANDCTLLCGSHTCLGCHHPIDHLHSVYMVAEMLLHVRWPMEYLPLSPTYRHLCHYKSPCP